MKCLTIQKFIPEFKHYKVEKGPKYQIEDVSSFPIANKAVSDVRKKIKKCDRLGYEYTDTYGFYQS